MFDITDGARSCQLSLTQITGTSATICVQHPDGTPSQRKKDQSECLSSVSFFLLFVFRDTNNFSPNKQTSIILFFCVIFVSVCLSVCLFYTHAPMYKHTRVLWSHRAVFFLQQLFNTQLSPRLYGDPMLVSWYTQTHYSLCPQLLQPL